MKSCNVKNEKIISRWISIDEACQYCSMSKKTIKKYINSGHIYGVKKGKWFVDRESIDEFFKNDNIENLIAEKVLASFR